MNRSIQKTWKRVLSVVLVFALLLPMIPAPVFAADTPEPTPEQRLKLMVGTLIEYRTIAENIQEELKKSPCLKTADDCDQSNTTECPDWTHRLLSDKNKFEAATEKFINDINRDLAIVHELTSGAITANYHLANVAGTAAYNTKTAAEKIKAADDFLNGGGYHYGKDEAVKSWGIETGRKIVYQLSYKSSFTGYDVKFSTLVSWLGGGFSITGDGNPVLPLAAEALGILQLGATSDNLGAVYNVKVAEINSYIDRAKALNPEILPAGASYTKEEFAKAIQAFIQKAERDLYVAGLLKIGNLEKAYADKEGRDFKGQSEKYQKLSDDVKLANALRFFGDGGYTYQSGSLIDLDNLDPFIYKSGFHPQYSSGLIAGIGANKTNVVVLMRETVNLLEKGHKYMTPKEQAKNRYDQALKELKAVKENPDEIIAELLEDDQELKALIGDLNLILGSLDDILNALDTLQRMGIGEELLNPILATIGWDYSKLSQLAELRDMLNQAGIDLSGDVSLEDSMGDLAKFLLDLIIGDALDDVDGIIGGLDNEFVYNLAAESLENTTRGLKENAAKEIKKRLEGVSGMIGPIRPYLGMMSSAISLVDNTADLVGQVDTLSKDFTAGGLSTATYTLADILDDLANLLTAFADTDMNAKLIKLLEDSNLGDGIADGTAALLNQLIKELSQQDIGVDKSDLGFLGDTAVSLLKDGLENPTALVPLLRTSSEILKRIAELEGGAQDIIDGNYEKAWEALSNNFGSMLRNTVTLWNELVALFETPQATQAAAFTMGMDAEEMNLSTLNGDVFLQTFAQGINDEAVETLNVLSSSASPNVKLAKINEFKEFLKDIGKFVEALRDMNKNVKSACDWANSNLSKEEAKAFAAQLAKHYVEKMRGCMEPGWNHNGLKNIISEMKNAADEIKDVLCFIKTTGDLKIIATQGDGEPVFYTLTTNYDALQAKLAPVLNALGISTGYTVEWLSDQFKIENGNTLVAASDNLEAKTYKVKVAYKLFFDVCDRDHAVPLATKRVDVKIGAGPVDPVEPELIGIEIVQEPNTTTYTVGAALDLTGLVVEALYEDENENVTREEISDYDVNPAPLSILDTIGSVTVTVSVGEFADDFTVTVNPEGDGEEDEFTVTFNVNGGTLAGGASNSITVASGTAITLPGATRADHTFNGWYDGTIKAGGAGDDYTVSKAVTLTASWTAVTPGPSGPSGPSGGGGGGTTTIKDEEIPLGGIFSLMSLPAEPRDGIVYYIDGSGKTVFVPFCFVIGDKIYFFGQVGIDYKVKANHKEFGDIGGHWAYDSILAIAEREAFQGYPDNSFQPNRSMTRSMLAVALARMATADTNAYNTRIFDDVAPDAWYGPSVAWAFEKGIVTGMGNNKFNPDANVTRQEMAVMLTRFISYMQIEMKAATAVPFADQDQASAWAKAAIADMQKYEIVGGKANNLFDPYADSTRAEIATMLHRLIQTSITHAQAIDAEAVKKTN